MAAYRKHGSVLYGARDDGRDIVVETIYSRGC
jgi:hypothetical protein